MTELGGLSNNNNGSRRDKTRTFSGEQNKGAEKLREPIKMLMKEQRRRAKNEERRKVTKRAAVEPSARKDSYR